MPGFFEAMKNIKPVAKKHTVTVQGKEIEVSLEKKLEIQIQRVMLVKKCLHIINVNALE